MTKNYNELFYDMLSAYTAMGYNIISLQSFGGSTHLSLINQKYNTEKDKDKYGNNLIKLSVCLPYGSDTKFAQDFTYEQFLENSRNFVEKLYEKERLTGHAQIDAIKIVELVGHVARTPLPIEKICNNIVSACVSKNDRMGQIATDTYIENAKMAETYCGSEFTNNFINAYEENLKRTNRYDWLKNEPLAEGKPEADEMGTKN